MTADLRSDTVTRPTPGMREAIAAAEVGDDVFGDDPTVKALERRTAELLGQEAALFVPSGTMGNQIAIQLLAPPGSELLADSQAHVVSHERGGAAVNGGISTRTWPSRGGHLDVHEVEKLIQPADYHSLATAAIAVENTHTGTAVPVAKLKRLRALADEHGLGLHCDGARLWHAHVAHGTPLAEFGRLFDTVSVCLSKGLGAPVGSVLASSAERIRRARQLRARMGGAMRQVGILAAAGLYALDHNVERLAEDHARAARLARALEPHGVVTAAEVQTNQLLLRVPDAPALAAAAAAEGVLSVAMGPRTVRLVTHMDVDDADVDLAIAVLTGLLGAPEHHA